MSCLWYWFNELLSICSGQERKEVAFRWLSLFVFCFCLCQNGCPIAIQANSPSRQLPDQHSTHTTLLHISLTFLVRLSHCQTGMFGTTLTSELLSASCMSLDAEQLSHNWLSKPHNQWTEPDKLLWRLRHSGETIWPQSVHLMFVDEDIFSNDIIIRQAANTHQCSL